MGVVEEANKQNEEWATQFGMDLRESLNINGLKFQQGWNMPKTGVNGGLVSAKKNGKPLRYMGYHINHPNIHNTQEYMDYMGKLDHVRSQEVFYKDLAGNMVEIDGQYAIVSNQSNQVYSIVSERYHEIQDVEVFAPFGKVAKELNLQVVGNIYGIGTGRTTGNFVIAHPDYVVPVMKEHDDYMMLGGQIGNSHNKDRSVFMKATGVRMICCNYGVWGDELGEFSFTHLKSGTALEYEYGKFLTDLVKKIPMFADMLQGAISTQVKYEDIIPLGYMIGLSEKVIKTVTDQPEIYERTIKTVGLNAYTVSNMFTAAITYMDNRQFNMKDIDEYSRNAKRILKGNIDKLVAEGIERKAAIDEANKVKLEKQKQRALTDARIFLTNNV